MGVGLVTSCFCINLLTGGVGGSASRQGQLPGWRLSLDQGEGGEWDSLGEDSYQAGGCLCR